MKKFAALVAMAGICTLGHAQKLNQMVDLGRYAASNREWAASGKSPVAAFMGNSIFEGWVRVHPGFFADNNFVGRGIGGQTSPQMLLRFRSDILELRPKVAVICAGTNDIAENAGPYDPDFTMGNIASMVQLANSDGICVVVCSVLPAAAFGWNPAVKDAAAKIDALNERLKSLAREQGAVYADFNGALRDENGALRKGYGDDGVHPNAEAYLVMEKIALGAVARALEGPAR